MQDQIIQPDQLRGLTGTQIPGLQQQYGKNVFYSRSSRHFIHIVLDIVKEPMFILLLIACSLYFILGELNEGFMMLVAMAFVAAVSIFQELKSTNALKALQEFSQPKVMVIRDGKEMIISSEELVPGDIVLLEEGMNIPADAILLQQNDCTVNESIITGESLPADKQVTEGNNRLYQGTTINSGKCVARVTETGNRTVLGKLGIAVGAYQAPKTLLQQQINRFVRFFAFFGLLAFCIIFFVNYLQYRDAVTSLLFALTLAMSAVPEEIPVAFSSFMALGAYKMSRLGIISRQPQVVENLGAVSVICLDKTGTITENKMQVKTLYDYESDQLIVLNGEHQSAGENVLRYALLASETNPFDAMEKAIQEACQLYGDASQQPVPGMIHEYPLEGNPPMMTHMYKENGVTIAAAKGAAERIIRVCHLPENELQKINGHVRSLASEGYRVIAVAGAPHDAPSYPGNQDDFDWKFYGLLALYDPPKKNMAGTLKQFYDAKIDVKMLTGDYPETAITIAGQVGIIDHHSCLTGERVMQMKKEELLQAVGPVNVFARMFPEAKLRVIEALKEKGEIVAMTGDGVNDGPALKSASVGIAMGKKGTEIARRAADLILTDDNLERMVTAISEGRKIFNNLKKAIRYIISIHIPIILTASLPVILGWTYPNIFTPIHIIFLELIMGPTCSIFFEREPVEGNSMQQHPRERNKGLFTREELLISVVQGLIVSGGVLYLYHYYMNHGASPEQTRAIVFTTLILSNIFLTFADRSFTKNIYYTIRYKNSLAFPMLIISAIFLAALHGIPAIRNLFQMAPLQPGQFGICLAVAFGTVMWFEVYKTGLQKPGIRP